MAAKATGAAGVGCYLRISTSEQEKGLESQQKAIEAFLRGHGIENAVWYRDRLSGKDTRRPAFEKLQRDIFCGQIKTVVTWKLDRLSRSMRDGINVLTDWLEKGVRIVAVSQQLDFSGSVGQLVAGVLFAVAQMERENLRENTNRGLAAAKAKGKKLGKPRSLPIEDIVQQLREGQGIASIAKSLGVSRQGIYSALSREGIALDAISRKRQ